MSQPFPFDALLVPQGAEHQAVARALPKGPVYPVPAGAALGPTLVALVAGQSWRRVLLMGLCGSLEPSYGIGTVVRYGACVDGMGERLACDQVQSFLPATTPTVLGFTSDQVVHLARDKRDYGLRYQAQVVDMEGLVALRILAQRGIGCAMVRVVSDDCTHDLPDLSRAFNAQGQIQPLPLALALLGSPRAGLRLIQGSLRALGVLERVAKRLT